MSRNSNFVVALILAAAGCGTGSQQGKTQQGEVVVAHHETRSSGSADKVATADKRDAKCGEKAVDPAMAEAKVFLEQKNYAAATQKLDQLTSEQPDNGWAWMMYGYALHASGDLDRALQIHEKAAGFPEQKATALYNVACVHALKGDKDSAFAALEQSIAAGFHKAEYLDKDTDLASLRSDVRFAQMKASAKEKYAAAEKSGALSHKEECAKAAKQAVK